MSQKSAHILGPDGKAARQGRLREQHAEQMDMARAFQQQIEQWTSALNNAELDDVFSRYDIPLDDLDDSRPEPRRVEIDTLAHKRRHGKVKNAPARAQQLAHVVQCANTDSRPGVTVLEHDQSVGGRVSTPGTPVIDGVLEVEDNSRYDSATVRGYTGDPGLYDEYWRQETVIRDAMQSNTEPLVSGSYELVMPQDDRIPKSKQSALEEWHGWWEGKTRHLLCEGQGGSEMVEHAAHHVQKTGFQVGEYEWYEDKQGRVWPEKLHPIECSSVYEWVLKPELKGLAGCDFDPGTYGEPYTLPYEGPELTDYKLHLANVASYNNNFEGVSPMRPSLFIIKLKQLLLRVIGVGVEGFGVPLKSVGFDPEALRMVLKEQIQLEGADVTDQKKLTQFFNAIKRVRAVDRNTVTRPFGVMLEMLSADGAFPAIIMDVLQYLDTLMAMPYSNEGGFLGLQSSVGSYKLGEIKDKQDLSSSFYYARNILKPFNRLTRIACREQVGELPEYPYWTFRLDGLTDNGRRTEDMVRIFAGKPVTEWDSEEARRSQAVAMDLSEDAFEVEKPEPKERNDEQGVAFKSRMASLSRSLGHAAEEARHIGCDHDHDEPVIIEHVAEHVQLLEHAEQTFDAERAERMMDKFEGEIAEEFRSIAWRQKNEWAREWGDAITSNSIDADAVEESVVRYRKKYLPMYTAAARAVLNKAAQEGMGAQLAEYVGVADDFAGDVTNATEQQIKLRADSISREMFNRAHGMLVDRMSEFDQGDARVGLEVPKKSTIRQQIAPRGVSSAFNRGRTQVQTAVKARAQIEGLKGEAYATRLSVLDNNTCETCEKLDGTSVIVGSKQYFNLQPPNKCEGRHRCRCVYVLTLSNNSDRDGFDSMMQKIRDNGGKVVA